MSSANLQSAWIDEDAVVVSPGAPGAQEYRVDRSDPAIPPHVYMEAPDGDFVCVGLLVSDKANPNRELVVDVDPAEGADTSEGDVQSRGLGLRFNAGGLHVGPHGAHVVKPHWKVHHPYQPEVHYLRHGNIKGFLKHKVIRKIHQL